MSLIKENIAILLRGMAMGAADVVPGVSGGTIAFISGIYDRLLNALKSINPSLLLRFKDEGIAASWKHIDGTFLAFLFGGILFSILSFAHLISFLLTAYPELLWSFFFGLILISAVHMLKQVAGWGVGTVALLALGACMSYMIGVLTPSSMDATYPMLFMGGCIAISAMILPGISGSFILLLMGLYPAVLGAVKSLDLPVLAIFGLGCITGLLTFSHLLSWLLKKHRDMALSLLTGLMIGALGKVWPWKETIETRINSSGNSVPFIQENISPFVYESVTGQPAFLVGAIALMFSAIGLVLLIEKIALWNESRNESRNES